MRWASGRHVVPRSGRGSWVRGQITSHHAVTCRQPATGLRDRSRQPSEGRRPGVHPAAAPALARSAGMSVADAELCWTGLMTGGKSQRSSRGCCPSGGCRDATRPLQLPMETHTGTDAQRRCRGPSSQCRTRWGSASAAAWSRVTVGSTSRGNSIRCRRVSSQPTARRTSRSIVEVMLRPPVSSRDKCSGVIPSRSAKALPLSPSSFRRNLISVPLSSAGFRMSRLVRSSMELLRVRNLDLLVPVAAFPNRRIDELQVVQARLPIVCRLVDEPLQPSALGALPRPPASHLSVPVNDS